MAIQGYLSWAMQDRNALVNNVNDNWDNRHPYNNREGISDAVLHYNVGNPTDWNGSGKVPDEEMWVTVSYMERRIRAHIRQARDEILAAIAATH